MTGPQLRVSMEPSTPTAASEQAPNPHFKMLRMQS